MKRRRAAAAIGLVVLLVMGFAVLQWRWRAGSEESLLPKDTSGFPNANTESSCRALDGMWALYIDSLSEGVCLIPTPDAGAECRSSDDCASFCVVKVRPEPLEVGDEVIGKCLDTFHTLGCHDLVEDGRYDSRMCID